MEKKHLSTLLNIWTNDDGDIVLSQPSDMASEDDPDYFVVITVSMIDGLCKELQRLKKEAEEAEND